MHEYWQQVRRDAREAMGSLITQAEFDEFFEKTLPMVAESGKDSGL